MCIDVLMYLHQLPARCSRWLLSLCAAAHVWMHTHALSARTCTHCSWLQMVHACVRTQTATVASTATTAHIKACSRQRRQMHSRTAPCGDSHSLMQSWAFGSASLAHLRNTNMRADACVCVCMCVSAGLRVPTDIVRCVLSVVHHRVLHNKYRNLLNLHSEQHGQHVDITLETTTTTTWSGGTSTYEAVTLE